MPKTTVLVVLDALRYDIFQSHLRGGSSFLSDLADRGTVFDAATATAPWSLPSYASMFTGRYPREHGALRVDAGIAANDTLLQDIAEAGVATGGFTANPFVSPEYGFEPWTDYRNYQVPYEDVSAPGSPETGLQKLVDVFGQLNAADSWLKPFINGLSNFGRNQIGLLDDGGRKLTAGAKEWLSDRDGDCFLFVNYMETHGLHRRLASTTGRLRNLTEIFHLRATNRKIGPSHYIGGTDLIGADTTYLKTLIADELRYLDGLIESLWESVVRSGRDDDCLFVVCADHGEALGERGFAGHLAGLPESVIRVPMLVAGPDDSPDRISERFSLSSLRDAIREFHIDGETDALFRPDKYPDLVGAETTGRIIERVNDKSALDDRYRWKRVVTFEPDAPTAKYLRIDDEYERREVGRAGLSETVVDDDSDAKRLVDAFESGLDESARTDVEFSDRTEQQLKELGYL